MKPIRLLDSSVVNQYAEKNSLVGEVLSGDSLLEDISPNLGALIYIDQSYFEAKLPACLEMSGLIQFHIVKDDGTRSCVLGQSDFESEDLFVRSAYAEQAAITYVHELNNHLAIICGRLYEFKKIRKSIEGELGEKFEKKLTSMNEKVDQITEISRLFTRKSIKANIPGMGEDVPVKTIVDNVARDYRKVLEKSSNVVKNEVSEDLMASIDKVLDIENILIAVVMKLARCTEKGGDGTQTTIECSASDKSYDFTFVLEGALVEEVQDNLYHRSWMSFLSLSHEKKCHLDVFQGKNKIHLELNIEKS